MQLGEALTGLDRPTLRLVLAAVAHAAGSHQHSDIVIDHDGHATITKEQSLYPWDAHVRPPGTSRFR